VKTRALRRHHAQRLKRKRASYWRGEIGIHWDTPHPCSGPCCGNPRRWFGERSVQEHKADREWEVWT
jgi:hypothetical protein